MKQTLFSVFIVLLYYAANSQIKGQYTTNQNDTTQFQLLLEIKDSIVEVSHTYSVSDDIFFTDEYFSSLYTVNNDTIIVYKYENHIEFLRIDSTFLVVLTDELFWVEKGTRFYRHIFNYEDGRPHMMGSTWKSGKKDGYWIFFDSLGIGKGYIMFDKGHITDTIIFDELMHNKDTIP